MAHPKYTNPECHSKPDLIVDISSVRYKLSKFLTDVKINPSLSTLPNVANVPNNWLKNIIINKKETFVSHQYIIHLAPSQSQPTNYTQTTHRAQITHKSKLSVQDLY